MGNFRPTSTPRTGYVPGRCRLPRRNSAAPRACRDRDPVGCKFPLRGMDGYFATGIDRGDVAILHDPHAERAAGNQQCATGFPRIDQRIIGIKLERTFNGGHSRREFRSLGLVHRIGTNAVGCLSLRIGLGIDFERSANAEVDRAAGCFFQFADELRLHSQTVDRETGGLNDFQISAGSEQTSRCPTGFAGCHPAIQHGDPHATLRQAPGQR